MLTGMVIASSASNISGARRINGADDPAARAATRNVARCPASTSTEEMTMPGQLPGASRPRRTSQTARRHA
jgi:hypothetical protein